MMAALPKGMAFALVSDHGFERVDRMLNPWRMLEQAGVTGAIQSYGTFLGADESAAAFFRKQPGFREIPAAEWQRFLPDRPKPAAAFEAPPHTEFVRRKDAPSDKVREPGNHGFWPLRDDYRSTFLLWGAGVKKQQLGEIDMLSIASRLANVLGISFGKEQQ
jgi:predicted AlkP superfamily pyrophosphatase or phosphodiesterase